MIPPITGKESVIAYSPSLNQPADSAMYSTSYGTALEFDLGTTSIFRRLNYATYLPKNGRL